MNTCITPLETIIGKTTDILNSSALNSGPMSLLCEFIEREIKDVIDTAPIDLDGAVSEANRALNRAYQELDDLIELLSTQPDSLALKQALGQADNAYYSGEGRLKEDLEEGERGDGLADFIAATIHEHNSESGIVSMRSVNESLKDGQSRIEACIEQIEQLTSAPTSRPRPSQ